MKAIRVTLTDAERKVCEAIGKANPIPVDVDAVATVAVRLGIKKLQETDK